MTRDTVDRHEAAIREATDGFEVTAWIDGTAHSAESGETFPTIDPAVGLQITSVPRCGAAEVDAAVRAANDAQPAWAALAPDERADRVTAFADALRDEADHLARLEALDTGKPEAFADAEIREGLEYLDYYADLVASEAHEHTPVDGETHAYTRHEPYGVAGLIVPWNYPVLLTCWKLGPALAAGNSVVLKPAEGTPLTATRMAQVASEVLPDGVVNVVHGYGTEAGAALTTHEGVDKLSFTGEDTTGEEIMSAAASNITPVTLELGGKSPLIVFPDADLERAAATAAEGIFYNAGQSCDALSRTLVHEDVHDEFLGLFQEAREDWVIGDPLEEGTTVGSLASADQFEKVSTYAELGTDIAELVAGGGPPDSPPSGDGWYFEPTIFDGVSNDSRLAQEEIFGPVASVVTFADYEEAITLANDVPYGLASSVATQDLSLAHRAAADIEAGTVWVNDYARFSPGLSFGGYKRSGIGRECGPEALEEYRQSKTVSMAVDTTDFDGLS